MSTGCSLKIEKLQLRSRRSPDPSHDAADLLAFARRWHAFAPEKLFLDYLLRGVCALNGWMVIPEKPSNVTASANIDVKVWDGADSYLGWPVKASPNRVTARMPRQTRQRLLDGHTAARGSRVYFEDQF